MPSVTSLEGLLYTIAGMLLVWLGRSIRKWVTESTADRRARADKLARTERRARLLTESLHEHRNLMIQSGQWSRESLPPFIHEE